MLITKAVKFLINNLRFAVQYPLTYCTIGILLNWIYYIILLQIFGYSNFLLGGTLIQCLGLGLFYITMICYPHLKEPINEVLSDIMDWFEPTK